MKKLELKGMKMLSKEQMKKIAGGDCKGYATCTDGTTVGGYLDCSDYDNGGDGDAACQAGGHGDSTSCDCPPQP